MKDIPNDNSFDPIFIHMMESYELEKLMDHFGFSITEILRSSVLDLRDLIKNYVTTTTWQTEQGCPEALRDD